MSQFTPRFSGNVCVYWNHLLEFSNVKFVTISGTEGISPELSETNLLLYFVSEEEIKTIKPFYSH